jgi:hypothetical protein
VEIAESADAAALTDAYGAFQQEALQLNPEYQPEVSAQYFGVAQAFLKQKQYSVGRHKVVK